MYKKNPPSWLVAGLSGGFLGSEMNVGGYLRGDRGRVWPSSSVNDTSQLPAHPVSARLQTPSPCTVCLGVVLCTIQCRLSVPCLCRTVLGYEEVSLVMRAVLVVVSNGGQGGRDGFDLVTGHGLAN